MSDPVGLLHPRKLYAMLRACPTAEARARAVLEFVRGSTGAQSGFLFYPRDGALVLAAGTRDRPPPAGLAEEAARAFAEGVVTPDDKETRDVGELLASPPAVPSTAWQAPSGETFERRVLSTPRPRWAVVAIVFLEAGGKPLLPVRHGHVEAICQGLVGSGDCTPLA